MSNRNPQRQKASLEVKWITFGALIFYSILFTVIGSGLWELMKLK